MDNSRVFLPDSIAPFVKRLAENSHDGWARQRMSEDWTYGPERDDAAKNHPCLVPYGELPESE